jgi:colanic acid/amylovoran biosynthesis glycosyltransferase
MRLAVIVNSFPEISETFITNHIAGEIIAGTDITVIAAHKPRSALRHSTGDRYKVEEKTVYLNIPRSLVKRFLLAPFLFIKLFFINPAAACEAVRFGKYQTAAKNMKLLFFGLYFARKRFDVVHCHFGMNGLIGAYLKNCGFCTKIVTTFHGADINSYPGKYGAAVYKTLYQTDGVITANTEFTKSKIIANGGPSSVKVIPVGLFFNDFFDDKMPDSVLTVGRLEEKKGYVYSLEAIARAKESIPSIKYYLIGDGSLREELEAYAEELGIGGNCHFLGARSDVEVRSYYKRCEVFMLPSVTAANGDMEGQGLVLQEAQASGLPVISTLHNGIPDGVLQEKTGFLLPEKNSSLLAEKLVLLLQNEALRKEMGRAGQAFVKDKYDVPVIVQQFNQFYEIGVLPPPPPH